MPQLSRPDPDDLPAIITREQALILGMTSDEIRQRIRSQRWTRLCIGVYLTQPTLVPGLDRFEQQRLDHARLAIACAIKHPRAVISHHSAAVVHGLPLVTVTPALVTLTESGGTWSGQRRGVRIHSNDLPVGETEPIDAHLLRNLAGGVSLAAPSLRATSLARTWADVAATGSWLDAVMAGDCALRHRLTTVHELRDAVNSIPRSSARALALRVLANLSSQRETAIESLAWVRFHEWGLPAPLMQIDIRDDRGHVGRVDFLWPEHRLIVEVDGRVKYRDEADLWHEKVREDRLRALGYRVIRCTWAELMDPNSPVRAVLRRALQLAA